MPACILLPSCIAVFCTEGPRTRVRIMRLRLGSKIFAALLLPSFFSACEARDPGSRVLRIDSAGIEIVESPGEDTPLPWTFEKDYDLGGEETGPESFFSVGPMTVGVDSGGRIHVLNPQESHVVIFSPEGDFIRAVGGHGEGPGEISMGASLAVSSAGIVSVFDFGKGGLVRFGPEGESLPTVPFRFYPWPGTTRHVAETADGFLVATMVTALEENTFRHALQLVTDGDTLIVADRSFPRPEMAMFPSCGGGLNLPRIFEVQVTWAAADGTVVVSRSDLYEVEVIEDGELIRKVRRAFGSRPASDEMAVEELGEGFTINFGQGPCTIPPREMVDARGFAETVPWIARVILAPGGEVWVGRKEVGRSTPGIIDVFDGTGVYLGTLPGETPFPLVFLPDNRFAAVETDALDISRLAVYRVLR